MEGPLLWYLNRATGLVLLILLTLSIVLGVLAMRGQAGRGVPRFVSQALHRNLALIAVVALVVHVVTAVVHSYVDIRWWQAVIPFGGTYEPLWLGLGTLSVDLIAVVVVTSLLRNRLGQRSWRTVHLLSWVAWGAAVAHSLGLGTDLADLHGLAVLPTVACVTAVVAALTIRLSGPSDRPVAAPSRSRS